MLLAGTNPTQAQAALARVRKIWQAGATRRADVADLLAIYRNDWSAILQAELKSRFRKENYDKLSLIADPSLNVLRWACDRLAKIYSKAPGRSLDTDADLSEYGGNALDLTLQEAARLLQVCRDLLLRPVVRDGALTLDVWTPDVCEVIPRDDDPTRMEAVIYQFAYTDEQGRTETRYAYWDAEEHWILNSGWGVVPIEGNEEGINPYGVVPFVACHARWPVSAFWHEEESFALKRATIEAALALTDLRHLMKVASYKQIVIAGNPGKDFPLHQVLDPSQPVLVGSNGSASILDLQTDFAALMDTIITQIGVVLNTCGIRPETFKGSVSAASGYALQIQNQDLEEQWNEGRRLWDVYEDDLYQLSRVVADVEGIASLPDGHLSLSWPEVGTRQDPTEVLTYWKDRIDAKLATRTMALMDMDGLTEEEAKALIKEIDKEQKTLSPLPVVPMFPRPQQPMPPNEMPPEPIEDQEPPQV